VRSPASMPRLKNCWRSRTGWRLTTRAGFRSGAINGQFLAAGASVAEYKAALRAAIERGLIALHASGAYLTFTQAGADLFA
jgi:hypothetical protein